MVVAVAFPKLSSSLALSWPTSSVEDKMPEDLDTSRIKDWRSIVTLIVFVVTSECTMVLGKYHAVDSFSLNRHHRSFSISSHDLRPSITFGCHLGCPRCFQDNSAKAAALRA